MYNKKAEYVLFRLRTRFYKGSEKIGRLLARQLKMQNTSNVIPAIKKGRKMMTVCFNMFIKIHIYPLFQRAPQIWILFCLVYNYLDYQIAS